MADFGESKKHMVQTLAVTLKIQGTPDYMAPEIRKLTQNFFDKGANFDLELLAEVDYFQADMFSMGIILLEMMAVTIPNFPLN